jgi:hypothetical protein
VAEARGGAGGVEGTAASLGGGLMGVGASRLGLEFQIIGVGLCHRG